MEFIKYELAKSLRGKGFKPLRQDAYSKMVYSYPEGELMHINDIPKEKKYVYAPTPEDVIKWLKQDTLAAISILDDNNKYYTVVYSTLDKIVLYITGTYKEKIKAIEAGVEMCLEYI